MTEHYRAFATRILAAAEIDSDGYAALTYLCDHIGNRNSGTPQLNTAVQWAAELMRNAGFENVAVQPVKVPHWVRGQEAASIIAPINRCLHMIGLGMNVGTPKEGITAPVVFVHDYTEREPTIAPTGRRELPQKEPSGWAAKTLVLSSRRAPVALSPHTVGKHYFDWHHSEADTLDKVDPAEFRHNIALLAITSYGQRRRLAISGSRKDRESREGVCSYPSIEWRQNLPISVAPSKLP